MGRISHLFLVLLLGALASSEPEVKPEAPAVIKAKEQVPDDIVSTKANEPVPDIGASKPYESTSDAPIILQAEYKERITDPRVEEEPGVQRGRSRRASLGYTGISGYFKCSAPEGLPGRCKPLASCAQYYGTADHYDHQVENYHKSCHYGYGSKGVCCPEVYYSGRKHYIINYEPKKYGDYDGKYVHVSPDAISQASKYCLDYMEKYFRNDKKFGRGEFDDSYWGNGMVKTLYLDEAADYGDLGYELACITKYLAENYGYKPESSYYGNGIRMKDYLYLLPEKYRGICKDYRKKCYYSKYRSFDGSCNNLKYSYYGAAYTAIGHLLIPKYSDKVLSPRLAYDGTELPDVRRSRNYMLPEKDADDKPVNNMWVNYGQYVAHDMTHVPFYQTNDGEFFDCCYTYKGGPHQVHPKCYTLAISRDDSFYSKHHQQCLNVARSLIAPNYECELGYANQLNRQTAWLDASPTYGKSRNDSNDLRTGKGGQLQMTQVGPEYVLPVSPDAECFNSSAKFCFKSGDLRTTIHPGITLIQIYFARFHNLVATRLTKYNLGWDDERLFQEARRITISVYQHITYAEYLPMTLGWRFMYDYGILPVTKGYSYDYDEYAKGRTYAEFSGAAFRFHSSVYGKVLLADEYYKTEKLLGMETLYNSANIYRDPKATDSLTRGYLITAKQDIDPYYDSAVSLLLLKNERHFGLDIGSMNMLRGREMGLASYNDYREVCGLQRAYKWDDLLDTIDRYQLDKLKKAYIHVDNIELYSGGLMERHVKDSLLGPTWWCIVGHQFQLLKRTDRYFYDRGSLPHSFSLSQLDEIRKMSFASLICMVTGVKDVPAFAFRTISKGNPSISCSDYEKIPRMSFLPWKSNPYGGAKPY